MSTINFSVPEDVKEAFNATFAGQNKSAILAQLMREAVARAEEERRRTSAVKRILERRQNAPILSDHALSKARRAGRS